jgi:hypothetical protein
MNETTIDVGQTDEDILTYEVSDEALEAAAGMEGGPFYIPLLYPSYSQVYYSCAGEG